MPLKLRESDARIRVHEAPPVPRSGGENRPYEYPHLYQIQAGDWRISYAVEQNHLAILVLEVLNPDGTVRKDPARETLTRKMKVKLLDWPEGSPSRDLPPEELGKKVKIKLLDLADELYDEGAAPARQGAKIRFPGAESASTPKRRVTLLDEGSDDQGGSVKSADSPDAQDTHDRKVTPLDSPTM